MRGGLVRCLSTDRCAERSWGDDEERPRESMFWLSQKHVLALAKSCVLALAKAHFGFWLCKNGFLVGTGGSKMTHLTEIPFFFNSLAAVFGS